MVWVVGEVPPVLVKVVAGGAGGVEAALTGFALICLFSIQTFI